MVKLSIIAILMAMAGVLVILVIGPRLGEAKIERLNRRMMALRDRVNFNPSDTNALNSLIASVRSRNSFERNSAIALLGQIGPRAEPAIPLLVAALDGPDAYDAREAARSLGEIGVHAEEVVPALTRAVKKYPSADIGWFAAESLGIIANPDEASVIEALEGAKKSGDARMAEYATRSLETLSHRRAIKHAQ